MPYSEHSSFDEMRAFVHALRPRSIVPTVNVGSPTARTEMQGHFEDWLRL